MANIADEQRQALVQLLSFDDDTQLENLFRTAEAMPTIDVSRQERDQVREFLKEGDKMMVRLALAHHAAEEAMKSEQADEILHYLTGMWTDLCHVLALPTLDTMHQTETHQNMNNIKKLIERLQYTKAHLSHGAETENQPRKKRAKTEAAVPTSNRFEALTDQSQPAGTQPAEVEADSAAMDADTTPPPKKEYINPIYILITGDWPAYIRHLNKNILTTPVKAKTSGEYMKITPATPDDYKTLTRHLIDTKMSFHALMPRTERPAKILIRGLPSIIQPELIAKELVEMGYTPIHISRLKKRGPEKEPLPLYLVTLKTTQGWEKIYEETALLETSVSIKAFRSTGSKQCYRCQAFGHSSQNCYMPPKCMKCAQNHESRDCKKPRSEKATCANCGGEHTSNYSGCPLHPKNLPSRGQKITPNKYSYQAYLEFLKNGPPKTVPIDAPLPKVPAWQRKNPKIYLPPGKNLDNFPKLPRTQISDGYDSDLSEVDEVPPPTSAHRRRAAENRAAAAAADNARLRKLRAQHQSIVYEPPSTGSAALGGFTDAMRCIQEFQQLVNLPLFITKLKEMIQAIKSAPTDLDRAYLVMEKLQGLSEAFNASS